MLGCQFDFEICVYAYVKVVTCKNCVVFDQQCFNPLLLLFGED